MSAKDSIDDSQDPYIRDSTTGTEDPANSEPSGSEDGNGEPGWLRRLSLTVDSVLSRFFFRLGLAVAKRPYTTMGMVFFFALLCSLGILMLDVESRGSRLWVPQDSLALEQQDYVLEYFPNGQRETILLYTAPDQTSDVLNADILSAMLRVHNDILAIQSTVDDTTFTYQDICVEINGVCQIQNILYLWNYDAAVIAGLSNADILSAINAQPAFVDSLGNVIPIDFLLGGIETNANGDVTGAKALRTQYLENAEPPEVVDAPERDKAEQWEDDVVQLTVEANPQPEAGIIFIALSSEKSEDDAASEAINADIALLSVGYILILFYVTINLGRWNLRDFKLGLSFGGIVAFGMAIAGSFGLSSLFGQLYGPVHSTLPFLILGIGVDDMFVVYNSFREISKTRGSVEERAGLALSYAGVSIALTSMTDFFAFLIGATTALPALSSFSIYAAIGIFLVFVFQCTWFVACIVIDERRVLANKNAVICCMTLKKERDHLEPHEQRGYIAKFFERYYAPALVKGWAPCTFAILLWMGVAGVAIYGATQIPTEFDYRLFMPGDHYIQDYYKVQDEYFNTLGMPFYTYTTTEFDHCARQTDLQELVPALENSQWTADGSVVSWYDEFTQWAQTNSPADVDANGQIPDCDQFATLISQYVQGDGDRFEEDVILNPDGSVLTARIFAQHVLTTGSSEQLPMMEDTREVVESVVPDNNEAFPFAFAYIFFESFATIEAELFRNLGLAMAMVFLIVLILTANLVISILILIAVTTTITGVLGFGYFWDMQIDTVLVINLVIAIGLSVDYSAHIGHTFLKTTGTRAERATETIITMGPSVLNGGISTFLAFALLANSTSYIFEVFFKSFFLTVVLGLFQGLVVLPAVLSLIGPASYGDNMTLEQLEDMEPKQRASVQKRKKKSTEESDPPRESMASGAVAVV
eukprot:Clim_evm83s147 gene=Clim_evmTU83s147